LTDQIKHFLLVFDHAAGKLEELVEFGEDSDAAVAAYSEKEKELQGRDLVEIVLIGSDSLDTVKLTHANYFDGRVAGSKYLDLVGTFGRRRRPAAARPPRRRLVEPA
jgi:hypothetical protein